MFCLFPKARTPAKASSVIPTRHSCESRFYHSDSSFLRKQALSFRFVIPAKASSVIPIRHSCESKLCHSDSSFLRKQALSFRLVIPAQAGSIIPIRHSCESRNLIQAEKFKPDQYILVISKLKDILILFKNSCFNEIPAFAGMTNKLENISFAVKFIQFLLSLSSLAVSVCP